MTGHNWIFARYLLRNLVWRMCTKFRSNCDSQYLRIRFAVKHEIQIESFVHIFTPYSCSLRSYPLWSCQSSGTFSLMLKSICTCLWYTVMRHVLIHRLVEMLFLVQCVTACDVVNIQVTNLAVTDLVLRVLHKRVIDRFTCSILDKIFYVRLSHERRDGICTLSISMHWHVLNCELWVK